MSITSTLLPNAPGRVRLAITPGRMWTLLLTAILLVLCACNAVAQSTFGSIVGTVQDQSGAVIGQVPVVVRNLDENSTWTKIANEAGEFQFLNLKPGRYEVSAQKPGFSRVLVSDITLDARQERRVNLKLDVAAVGQVLEVTAEATNINTENATIADTKGGQQVIDLPLNYRGATTSPLAALAAAPGVQPDNGGKIAVGGGLPSTVQYSLDGVSTDNVRHTGALANMYPSSELISEFRVSAVNNNAEFAEVGDVTVTTKSGTNQFHGSAFEYLQNTALDATTYDAGSKPQKVANTLGGSLGGPVAIPHVYNGRNRTFFFADFEGNRLRKATAEQYWVPTAGERAGNLADLLGGEPLVDPIASTVGDLVTFPNGRIPSNRISPVAQKLLRYYPLPNADLPNGNYVVNAPTPINTNGYNVRVDQVLTSKQQLFARWSRKSVDSATVNTFLPTSNVTENDRSLVLSHNYTIAPTLLNEFRFGLSWWRSVEKFPINGVAIDNALGLTGLDLTSHPESGAFPYFDFSNGDSFTPIGRAKDGPTQSTTYQYADNLSWIKGRNTLKFGADLHQLGYRDVEHFAPADDFGTFTFSQAGFTGNALGDLLLGLPSSTYSAFTGPDLNSHSTHWGFFAQDELRLTRKLTVSFGLRWELHPAFSENKGNITNFDFAKDAVIVPDRTLQPAQGFLDSINLCPGGPYRSGYYDPSYPCTAFEPASQAHLGQGLGTNYYGNWDPRLGIAYRPLGDSRTVIRAGIGIFTAGSFGTRSALLSGVHTANTQFYGNFQQQGIAPSYQFPQALGGNGNTPVGMAMFMCGVDPHLRDPESAQWNFTIERELPKNFTARASYIGMNTYRLENMEDINQARPSTQKFDSANRPWTNWDMVHMLLNNAGQNYQSFQMQVDRRYSHGLYFQGSYTLAKSLTNAEGTAQLIPGYPYEAGATFTNRFDRKNDRGNDFATRRNRLLFTAVYDLPVGRGHRLLGSARGLSEAVLGGWKLSTISLFQTGPFQTPISAISDDPANIGVEPPVAGCHETATRPDRIGNGNISTPTPNQWYSINAFTPAIKMLPDGTHIGVGRDGSAGMGILVGPGTVTVAAGLAKEFSFSERAKLRFEASFTNLLNHPNFAPPSIDISNPQTFGVTSSVQSPENGGNRVGQLAVRLSF